MGYEQPEKQEGFKPRDHPEWLGQLFIIYPISLDVAQFKNDDGTPNPTEVITADVGIPTLVDPETGRPKVIKGARIAGKGLVPAIKPKLSKANTAAAGRLRKLPGDGKKEGAYVLDDFAPTDGPILDAFEATGWRASYEQPAVQSAPPTGVASSPPATATPAAAAPATPTAGQAGGAATGSAPWYATDTPLLTKLVNNGVANAVTLDYATAQAIGAQFPG